MYKSTRKNICVSTARAIVDGISKDGGLYVPDIIPIVNLDEIRNLSYKELSVSILSKYLYDFTIKEVEEIVNQAYDDKFDNENIVQLKKTKDCFFLELFHGPTLAFKDLALTMLPHLMIKSKEKLNIKAKTLILTATSGDTGSAALSGFQNADNIEMVVFYPSDGVSLIQEAQMLKYSKDNALVIALEGNFDDAQSFVKSIFADDEFKQNLVNTELSSANSINIGRLIPQIVYYFYAYNQLLINGEINLDEKINFSVPTGNFGNILAAYLAKQMGLPIKKLICASNTNNVLTDFFNKGIYNKNRKFYKTISPSMDILVSSNLERLLYFASNRNCEYVEGLMNSLKENHSYEINDVIKNNLLDFVSYYTTEDETLKGINKVYYENNYLIDTHSSVAYMSYLKYLEEHKDQTKTVIVATAHPYKFANSIIKSLNIENKQNDFENLIELEKFTKVRIPNQLRSLMGLQFSKEIWKLDEAKNLLKEKVK